eukprot:5566494-Pyramimonas_sp.AAC.1
MSYRTELLDVFVLIQCSITAPILAATLSTIGKCMFVGFTFTKTVLNALDALVDGVLSTGQIDSITMFGCEKATACLELLVERRASETKASRASSELQREGY